jgi:hypothetical protein
MMRCHRTIERIALVAHLLGLGIGTATIMGLIRPVTNLVRMLL